MKYILLVWLIFSAVLFREIFINKFVAVPADTLVGAYLPWLDYKWGYAVGVPVKNPIISDVFSQFFIWKHLAADLMRNGVLPLMNNSSFSGTPFLATYHSAVFFPANLLIILLPKYWGWNLFIYSSILVSGMTMCLYLSNIVKSKIAIFVGSLLFALSGPMTTWTEFGTGVWAAAFIPLTLYSLDKFFSGKKNHLFMIPLWVLFTILAGHVQIDTYLFVLYGTYTLFRSNFKFDKESIIVYCKAGLAFALGVGMAALQLLPTAEFYKYSIRSQEHYSTTFNYGLSAPRELVRIWASDFFGHPATYNQWSSFTYHEYSNFLGTLSLPILLSVIILLIKRKEVKYFSGIIALILILAYNNPLSRLIFSLPLPLLTYSSASRIFFVLNLSAGVLVAIGIEKMFTDKKFLNISGITSLILILITLFLIILSPNQYKMISFRNSILPVFFLGTLLCLSIIKIKREIIVLIIAVILCFDLARYFRKYNPFVSERLVFPTTPIIEYLQKNLNGSRILNSRDSILPPNTWAMYRLSSIEGYDPLHSLIYSNFMHVVNNQKYSNSPSRYVDMTSINRKFLNILDVKYLIADKPKKDDNYIFYNQIISEKFPLVFEDGNSQIFINDQAKGTAFFVNSYKYFTQENLMASELESNNFDPIQTALLLKDPHLKNDKKFVNTITNVNRKDANTIIVDTNNEGNGILIISQSYDPGWKAVINNQKTEIFKTNGSLMSVVVSGGKNTVTLKYLPDAFIRGVWISIFSAFILLVSYIISNVRYVQNKHRHSGI